MKTSELKKIVEENEYEFQKTENFIHISYFGRERMTLDLQNQAITVDDNVRLTTPRIKKIMVALLEYSLTPISEREDEKKFRTLDELVDKATQVKPPTYEEIKKACDCLGYEVSFNHYDDGMRLKLFNRLTLDSMTVFTHGDIAFTSNPEMYGIKKEFSQLHCLIIRYLESREGE